MDPPEDLIDRDIPLTVLLPGGQETSATVHGSKPVMDVLVALCAQHHLVPSDHVIKLISTNQNHINFKPNSMIGSLEFERVVLQTKGSDANKKKPNIPVATVRLLINYKKSHKAVVRVNPAVPLIELMPTVCEKCEFNPDDTILLKTYQSEEPLDLTKTLNDYGVRELYAKEMKAVPTNLPVDPVSIHKGGEEEQKTPVKEKKGNKGFFGLFKKSKKTSEQAVTDSAELNGQCADRVNGLNGHSTLPTVPADMPKKRRAPRPPMTASQSVCGHTRDFSDLPESDPAGKQGQLSRISSTESSLKRTKRRAPPPPCDGPAPSDSDNKVEEAQGDDRRSDKYRAHITDRCPAISKVMSELVESLQARQQRTLSSANSSISQNQSAEDSSTGVFSEHHTPEAELQALPDCQLLRSPSEREGLTTFTVIPQRRQQSRQCFEMPLTLQTPDAAKAEEDWCPGDPDALETPTIELLEEVPSEIFRNVGKSLDKSEHLSEIVHLQHLEKENQALTDTESENLELRDEEDQCNQWTNEDQCNSHPKGLTTFTVIPLRRQQSRQCFEMPLTLQTPDAAKAEEDWCPGDSDALETTTIEFLGEVPSEIFRNEGTGLDKREHLSEIVHLQHLEKENQALTDTESENLDLKDEEDQYNSHPKNTELESSLQRGLNNLEHFDSKMNNLELRDSWSSLSEPDNKLADSTPIDPNTGLVEREETDALVENEEEKDWVEQYKERRRKFLNGNNDGMKRFDVWGRIQREFTNVQEENTVQDFPSPPPPVHWDENGSEYKEDIENGSEQEIQSCEEDLEQWANFDPSANSKPEYVPYPHYSKPNAHSTQTNTKLNTSGAENNGSFTPEPHKTSILSKSNSSFDPCPPAAVSLFALAVFQRAKHSKPGLDPNCSRR